MKKKLPYLPLYTGDWKKDVQLSLCSAATRGVWIDLLCAMHDDDRSGIVSGTLEELAPLARVSVAEFSAAVAELKARKTADVTFRNAKVTIVNRKMRREHKSREAARLRQHRHRSREGHNANVTRLSSMSPSISRSTDDRRDTRRDDQKFELSEEEIATVRRRANAVAKAVGKRATAEGDRSLVLKAAILSLRSPFNEQWLYSAAEGVKRSASRKGAPYGYLHTCLAEGAAKFGRKLNTELAKTKIPDELAEPPPAEEPDRRLCASAAEPP